MPGTLRKSESIKGWKVEAEPLRPKDMLTNSKRPKGVVQTVFSMSYRVNAWEMISPLEIATERGRQG